MIVLFGYISNWDIFIYPLSPSLAHWGQMIGYTSPELLVLMAALGHHHQLK